MNLTDLPLNISARVTIDPDTGCWRAGPPHDRDGYAKHGGQGLHRVVYRLLVGEIPAARPILDHVLKLGCIWPDCIWPAHLEPVTVRVNTMRGCSFAAMNARKEHCGACGCAYDLWNTYWYKGRRDCRCCIRRRVRQYQARLRAASSTTELRLAA